MLKKSAVKVMQLSDFYLSPVSGHPGSINVARGFADVTIKLDVERALCIQRTTTCRLRKLAVTLSK